MKNSALSSHLIAAGSELADRLPGAAVEGVRAMRSDALAKLAEIGLPSMTDEQWRYTNIRLIEKVMFQPASNSQMPVDDSALEKLQINASGMYRIVFLDGWYSERHSMLEGLPHGIEIGGLAHLLDGDVDTGREIVSLSMQRLNNMAKEASDGFRALNCAFAADGAVIHLARGAVLDKPLEILSVSRDDSEGTLCNLNHFVHAEPKSKIEIIERYASLGETGHLTNSSMTLDLEKNSMVDHYRLQEESELSFHFGRAAINQSDGSHYRIYSLSFGALLNRHEIAQLLDGEQSQCDLKGLYIGHGRQHIDNYTTIVHGSANCTSNEFYKGILDDRARSVFHGRIKVEQDSQHTDAQQQNRNLLLSRNAEADTKPQLEIYADDVKCSHGATVGQLDEQAVFYLRSRGLKEDEARTILTHAFAQEIVNDIELTPVRKHVDRLVQEKLQFGIRLREAA